jgi:hypothetical protein
MDMGQIKDEQKQNWEHTETEGATGPQEGQERKQLEQDGP